jgi:hypothetical protein
VIIFLEPGLAFGFEEFNGFGHDFPGTGIQVVKRLVAGVENHGCILLSVYASFDHFDCG